MKTNIKIFLFGLIALSLGSCEDERALVLPADNFNVKVAGYVKMISDTIVVNVNENVTFNFPDGCSDEILFYSGESGKEFRFAQRGLYKAEDGTTFESKITVNTVVKNFINAKAKDFTLFCISGLANPSVEKFAAASKTELMKLRATSKDSTLLAENFVINTTSTPISLAAGDLNLAIVSKSADATKNMLSIPAAGVVVTNTEIRNYGYSKNGVVVTNSKTLTYPQLSNIIGSDAWAQFAPDSTVAPGATAKVLNASGYSWNTGEIGVSYAPAVTGTAAAPNKNGVTLAVSYPVSVTAPLDVTKVVAEATAPAEAWLISRAVNPAAVVPDVATIVKRVEQSSMKNYQYIYKERGIYKVSFVGINVGINGTTKVTREFVILVKNVVDNI